MRSKLTNESPTYHPSFSQMLQLVKHLSGKGLDLAGALVIVYAALDKKGLGKRGKRYRVTNSASGLELIPE